MTAPLPLNPAATSANEGNSSPADEIVQVRRQPTDWGVAQYRRSDDSGLHWTDISGGVGATLTHPFVHGYVLCDAMISGGVAHSCRHGPAPHSILVCLLKKDNPELWASIEEEIGPRPGTKRRERWIANVNVGGMKCANGRR
jgi:hypothetical protein